MSADIQVRPGRDDERALVLQSFVREYHTVPYAKGLPENALAAMMTRLLDAWGFTVAVEPESGEVLGFIVYDRDRVAWLQVKKPYRGHGVARALMASAQLPPATSPLQREILVPFLPSRGLPAWIERRGYKLHFRPWMALDV